MLKKELVFNYFHQSLQALKTFDPTINKNFIIFKNKLKKKCKPFKKKDDSKICKLIS